MGQLHDAVRLSSRSTLDACFVNAALHEKFTAQRAPFVHHLRMDRAWGTVDLSLTAGQPHR